MSLESRAFSSLSIRDLLEAREAYHVHLAHLENVVATAIGRYRIRMCDPDAKDSSNPSADGKSSEEPRTLQNSVVCDWSWPCILVFVDRWFPKKEFAKNPDQMVPRRLYLPDGRIVPTCVVVAENEAVPPETPTTEDFPSNIIGGGYPVAASVQGRIHTGSVACLVTDGDATYALTNRHVTGPVGRPVFAKLGDDFVRIGESHDLSSRKLTFSEAYPGWPGDRTFVNLDAGLIRIDDLSLWTTQILGIGRLGPLIDLNVDTLSLDLIGTRVRAYGAASGNLAGEVQALLYRYRSVGGFEFVSDLLIGPRAGRPELLQTRHGDSGTLWVVDSEDEATESPKNSTSKKGSKTTNPTTRSFRPLAVQWGGHVRTDATSGQQFRYALATSLSTICRVIDVDLLRDWNNDLPEFWGATGHYTIGAFACLLPKASKLKSLMEKNVDRVSFDESTILSNAISPAAGEYFPLADVPDTVWKNGHFKRGRENPNHFADMDEEGQGVFADIDLFKLSEDTDKILPAAWDEFYDNVGTDNRHKGSLPFRVWQLYVAMVKAAKAKDVTSFVGVAGVLAHYVGDACQPLHCSRLHDGDSSIPGSEGVHSAYETKMIGRFRTKLFDLVKAELGTKTASVLVTGGHEAAVETVALMRRCATILPPSTIIDSYVSNSHRIADMWADLKNTTAEVIADGCLTLASLWESAWAEGSGQSIAASKIKAVEFADLESLYQDPTFIPSMFLNDMAADTTLFHL